TPSIQNLIRENKSFRIDSEIQTGKKFGMQLLDDNLWMHFTAGKISAEETIDKSKNPGYMIERMQKAGIDVQTQDEALLAQLEDVGSASGAAPAAPAAAGGGDGKSAEAER